MDTFLKFTLIAALGICICYAQSLEEDLRNGNWQNPNAKDLVLSALVLKRNRTPNLLILRSRGREFPIATFPRGGRVLGGPGAIRPPNGYPNLEEEWQQQFPMGETMGGGQFGYPNAINQQPWLKGMQVKNGKWPLKKSAQSVPPPEGTQNEQPREKFMVE